VEETRRVAGLNVFDSVRRDWSLTWRSLRRAPGMASVVIVTLALRIGANAATFSFLDEIYLRPPAGIRSPATLRRVWIKHKAFGDGAPEKSQAMNYPMFQAVAAATGDSSSVALHTAVWNVRMGRAFDAPRINIVFASANYFEVLGVRAERGRFFTGDEGRFSTPSPVVVISDAFWRSQLGAKENILGTQLEVGGRTHTIVGIVAPPFTGLGVQSADAWVPLATYSKPDWMREPWWESTNIYAFGAIARVTPSFDETHFTLRATQQLRALNRERNGKDADTLMTAETGSIIEAQGPSRPGQELLISTRLSGGAVLLLLIAGANVINLLLARAVARRREIALRLALGISRRQLVRLLMTETLLLTALAAAAACLVGWWGGTALRHLLLPAIEWSHSAFDLRIALFTAVVAAVAGLIAALVPALQASRADVATALADSAQGGGRRHRWSLRRALVFAQAGLSVCLLMGAALFVRSLRNVQSLDLGYDTGELLFARARFADGEAPPDVTIAAGMRDVARRLQGRPGVQVVVPIAQAPMQGYSFIQFYYGADSASALGANSPSVNVVSPRFFAAAGIAMRQGTGFSSDSGSSPAAEVVVNEAAARLLWPGRPALGQCLVLGKRGTPCVTVVGVSETVRRDRVLERSPIPQLYLPLGSSAMPLMQGTTLMIRAEPAAFGAISAELRSLVRETWPASAAEVTPMSASLEPEYRPWRLGATLFGTFALLAVLVAAVGIFGTVSYDVSQRRREFGIRMALGAGVGVVLRQVLRESASTVAIGIVLGALASLALGRLVAGLLYGIAPNDPPTLVGVGTLLLAISVVAALVPAWRAARVDPVQTLRSEA
jgi:predicted permease